MVERVQEVVLREPTVVVSRCVQFLQSVINFVLVHLLLGSLIHYCTDIIHNGTMGLLFIEIVAILLVSPVDFGVFLVEFFERLETVVHQFDGLVHVSLRHEVTEMEFGHGLRNSDDGEEGSRSDVHVADLRFAFPLEFSFLDVAGHDVLVKFVWDCRLEGLRLGNKRPHNLRINFIGCVHRCVQLLMDHRNVLSQLRVHCLVSLIQKKENQIKPGEQSSGQIDVLMRFQCFVVSAINGVGSRQD